MLKELDGTTNSIGEQESQVFDELVRLLVTYVVFPKNNPFGFYRSREDDHPHVKPGCFYALYELLKSNPGILDTVNQIQKRSLRAKIAVGVLSLFTTAELKNLFDHENEQIRREYFYTFSQEYAELCMQVVADAVSFLPYKNIGLYRESSKRVTLAVRDVAAVKDGQLSPYKLRQIMLSTGSSDVLYEVWVVR